MEKAPRNQGIKHIQAASLEDLIRIAQKQDQVVVYTVKGGKYSFYVRGDKEVYTHELKVESPKTTSSGKEQAK